jgi:Tfp pilus assembly PilM family ATPase
MTSPASIGLYWGLDHFSVVESIDGQISNIFHIPFDTAVTQNGSETVPDALKFSTLIQKTLEFRSVKTQTVNICIPTSELIFRSFTIPLMDKKDLGNVIEFEVTKYIPIKLDDLVYTYHTVPYTENNNKNLRALFLAIRKTQLESIVHTIEKSGLQLQNIEPAPISLMHLLKRHNIMPKNKTCAILEIGDEHSEIIVFENETLHFMRKLDISLNHSDLATLLNSLQNEVRVSFNFYNRQSPNGKIDTLIVLAEHKMPGAIEILKKELNIPVSLISIDAFIPLEEFQTNAHATAYGSTLRKTAFSPKFFDLSQKAIEMQRSGKDPFSSIKQYGVMAGIIAGCLITIFLTVIISGKMLSHNNLKIQNLTQKLGAYQSLTAQDIIAQKQKIMDELESYTSIQSTSKVALILLEIPRLLPDGMWLTGFQISSDRSKSSDSGAEKFKITLNGKIYDPDANEQFHILNNFIAVLKNNKKINIFYKEVRRDAANRTTENGQTITTFSITCS